jgi:hypothetical protein
LAKNLFIRPISSLLHHFTFHRQVVDSAARMKIISRFSLIVALFFACCYSRQIPNEKLKGDVGLVSFDDDGLPTETAKTESGNQGQV